MCLIAITSRSDTVSSPPDLFVRTPESILHMPIGSSLHVLGQLAMFPRPQHVASDSSSVTGIPDDAVVAGVLCRIDKWNRHFLAAVARAVAANPRVHLWMPEMLTTASSRARVMDIFAREGLPLVRVHWVPTLDRNKHLLYKRRIDLVFDTFPYSGHMTTGDALCVHPFLLQFILCACYNSSASVTWGLQRWCTLVFRWRVAYHPVLCCHAALLMYVLLLLCIAYVCAAALVYQSQFIVECRL